ncbi:MAG: zinc ribbon domain-containing protein [Xanthomonadales bacterium]|nr:zinc ribbon domain-containing protein [Xanthomonadales bacterium]
MPIYEFDCTACGHGFERLQKMSDADPSACPACGQSTVKRRLSAPSFRLAGAGWYETDFKSDKDRKRNLAGKDEGSAPASGDKPAATPATPAPAASTTASPAPAAASSGAAS